MKQKLHIIQNLIIRAEKLIIQLKTSC